MRPLLVAINSMYIQTCLAVRCLHAHCQGEFPEIQYREYQVSEPISFIAGDIYQQGCNPIGFSCSIWNIVPTLQTASILKKVQEDLVIVLGGPEAGADPEGILRDHPYIDWIVCGEGETPFLELLRRMERGEELAGIPGLAGRVGSRIVYWPPAAAAPIPVLPYGKADDLKNRIAYIESSRGCPFRCSYCLSSRTPGVTYFPLGQVKHRLNRVMAAGPREIKFVDRTFNLDRKRTLAIWSHILARTGPPCHFEIEGRLLDDDMLRFLAQVPEGRFNFEVGVQSTDPAVLAAVNRSTDWGRPRDALVRLRRETNVHLTLDLIAGLPEQTPASFARSFNEVYHLQPHRLQLNFLKVLPGTDLRRDAHRFGLIYADHPPYDPGQQRRCLTGSSWTSSSSSGRWNGSTTRAASRRPLPISPPCCLPLTFSCLWESFGKPRGSIDSSSKSPPFTTSYFSSGRPLAARPPSWPLYCDTIFGAFPERWPFPQPSRAARSQDKPCHACWSWLQTLLPREPKTPCV